MKKFFVILVALIGFGIHVYAQWSPEKQVIIDRQRAEIQQKRNSADEYQQKANEAGRKCEMWKNTKDPGEKVETITLMISYYCGQQEIYQAKADNLRKEANEVERLLNEAIEKAKK